jgi:hypothetical protein
MNEKKNDAAKTSKTMRKTTVSTRPQAADAEGFPDGEEADDEALIGGEAAVAEFRAEAEAVDERDVRPFRGSATLAIHNVRAGVAAVMAERSWFERDAQGPKVDFTRLAKTIEVARAMAFAARRAEQVVIRRPDMKARFARAAKLRRVLLKAADALVDAGLLDADAVAAIKAGRGWFDVAQDCVDLASLFRRNAAKVRGKTAVTAAQLREAAQLGEELLDTLTPEGAKPTGARARELADAIALRDRLGTVLAHRYAEVERAAGWRWGRALGDYVPSVLSRVRSKRAADDAVDTGKTPANPA